MFHLRIFKILIIIKNLVLQMYCFLMYFCCMIIVTGSAGFIGSCLVNELNYLGYYNLILVDDFSNQNKNKNLKILSFIKK